ncbi:MAG TPA: AAA family ATPase, partial [Longimicrobiaceae bacterium]|nr:AAA family ATPase [Longimicrobiaceae bacterium]
MRLKKVDIHGFRSVPDRLVMHVRPTLTCLIGANEHGKSNLLDAIHSLATQRFDEFDHYSHSQRSSDPRVTFTFELSTKERGRLLEVLKVDIKSNEANLKILQ